MDITSQQIKIIKTTWAIPAANPEDSGEAVLLAFFEKYPHNQEYFKAFKNVPLETLKVHAKKKFNLIVYCTQYLL